MGVKPVAGNVDHHRKLNKHLGTSWVGGGGWEWTNFVKKSITSLWVQSHLKEEDKLWVEGGEGGQQAHCVAPGSS